MKRLFILLTLLFALQTFAQTEVNPCTPPAFPVQALRYGLNDGSTVNFACVNTTGTPGALTFPSTTTITDTYYPLRPGTLTRTTGQAITTAAGAQYVVAAGIGAVALTIADQGTTGFADGWTTSLFNGATGNLTVTAPSSTFVCASACSSNVLTLATNTGAVIHSRNGIGYIVLLAGIGSGGTTINSTNNVLPVRSNASTFVDSPFSVSSGSGKVAATTDVPTIIDLPAAAVGKIASFRVNGAEVSSVNNDGTFQTYSTAAALLAGPTAATHVAPGADCGTGATNCDGIELTSLGAEYYVNNVLVGTLFNPSGIPVASQAIATLTDGATVTWATTSLNAVLTFTVHSGARTLNVSGLVAGNVYLVKLIQDGTGGETLTGGTGCTWKQKGGGAGTFTLTATASAVDILTFYYDGTNCNANLGLAYN